jgi:transcriptional regulator with XRE-family HTH domain
MSQPATRRIRPPRHAPHPRIVALRENGWSLAQIANAVGASAREVTRWAAGDTRPIPVYERELGRLLASASA